MAARVPLDVDLEDKLLYGLTPMRLAYVVASVAAGFALWSAHWAWPGVRACVSGFVIGIGAAAGWGQWRGRPADRWLVDIALFATGNYRVELDQRWLRWIGRRRRAPKAS